MDKLTDVYHFESESSYVVYLFSFTCPHCQNSFANVQQFQQFNVVDKVIGISILDQEAMERFYERDVVVYLKLSYKCISKRIGDPKKRGVVLKDDQTLKDLYEERSPLYEKYAHVIVDADDLGIGDVMHLVKDKVISLIS